MDIKRKKVHVFSITVCCMMLVSAAFIVINKQNINDQIAVWSFSPSSSIKGLSSRSGMNSKGEFVFFASHPLIDSTQNFNTECDNVENVVSVLGCYVNGRIYIYGVSDPKLDGIKEVTASHEMLHAAYDRLSPNKKKYVNILLVEEYNKIKDDESFTQRMSFYAKTEPGQLNNELHSVIGTEIMNISDDLEDYYKSYFSSREKVVKLNQKYLNVFTELKNQADLINSRLDQLATQINTDTNEYNQEVNDLNSAIIEFNNRADSGQFNTQSQFSNERGVLLTRISSAESDRLLIKENIDQYDILLSEYNSIATESKKLYSSLDSTLAPAPSI